MSDESWRRNGTCGACSHFNTDFGNTPTFYGHCKMYARNGSRSSNDATCHEFRPLPGFEEKVVLNVRTKVPDSRRAERRPVDVDISSIVRRRGDDAGPGPTIKRRRDGDEVTVVPEETRQFFRSPPARPAPPAPVTSEGEAPPPQSSEAASEAIAGALSDPGGGVDTTQMEDAMLDVVESFAAVAEVSLTGFAGGSFVLRPQDAALKPHVIDIVALFHKFVMIRDRIRVLEQKINANGTLGDLEKIELHVPITQVYGALTAFNSLFRASAPGWRRRRPTRRPVEDLLRRHVPRSVIELGSKWVGGTCLIQPDEGSDEEALEISIDLIFDRICRLKRRMRELERAVQGHARLSDRDRAILQDYISKSYGSLTTFNSLFRHRDDWFSSR